MSLHLDRKADGSDEFRLSTFINKESILTAIVRSVVKNEGDEAFGKKFVGWRCSIYLVIKIIRIEMFLQPKAF
ncbi:hypothetical protein AAU57_13035 [Nonlabens sp. YIK11]|nr:hypothetical protein AAU57_13035 [Nonlabens sp. YIK11]